MSRNHSAFVQLIAESLIWGAMMSGAAFFSLMVDQARTLDFRVQLILAVYFAGGAIGYFLAFPATWLYARLFSARYLPIVAIVMLTGITLAVTAGLLALDYRAYYAQWHSMALSKSWFYQQFYTALGSTYQFLVIGTRLYWPFGPLFLLLTGWWVTKRLS